MDDEKRPELDDAPPVLGSWRNIYGLVLGVLCAIVVALAVITKVYAP